jgi:hypothetical protein
MSPDAPVSPQRREEIIRALARGTVPPRSLDVFAVGLERFETAIDEELARCRSGGAVFKAIRGEYGSGKTFFGRWLEERGKKRGFASTEVQISETETPLHRLETVYRRAIERLSTNDHFEGAFRSIIDGWFYGLEEEVIAAGNVDPQDSARLVSATEELMEKRLSPITRKTPQFQIALRAYRQAWIAGDHNVADGLIAWLAGQPQIGAAAKRAAGIKGDIDHFGALSFLEGLLGILRDGGFAGLVFILDEVETLQRVRSDVREKSLNALRQLVDEIDGGRFPGLYLAITGTTAFFEGPQGMRRLEPLAQRLRVDFETDARFDNPRAVQIRLPGFTHDRLVTVGKKIRDLYAEGRATASRLLARVGDDYIGELAVAVAGELGGKVGVAPRIFLGKLVADVLDRVDQFEDFDPRTHYKLTMRPEELSRVEREAYQSVRGAGSADDVTLEDL